MMTMKHRRTILCVEALEDRCAPATWGNAWPDGAHLTLSFAPDGTQVGSYTSNLYQTFDAIAPTKIWQAEILRAFQTWAAQANLNIAVVADQGQPLGTPGVMQSDSRFGDIRIAAHAMSPGAIAVASPFDLAAGTWSGDVQLNSAVSFGMNGSGQYDLFTVALHEAGHVFGLPDNNDPNSVECIDYLGVRTALSAADIAALQAINGLRPADAFEGTLGNNQFSTATRLNPIRNADGSLAMSVNADVTTLQDRDVYSFNSLLNLGAVDVTLRTAGISLLTPRLTVYNAAGAVISSTVYNDPLEGGVVLRLKNIKPLSTYYIRVESGQPNAFGIGSYELGIRELPFVSSLLGSVTTTVTHGLTTIVGGLLNNDLHTNDSFATASLIPEVNRSSTGTMSTYRGSISDASDVDFYRLQAPAGSTNTVLTAMVWGLQNQLDPRVRVFDAQQHLVAAEIVVNDSMTYAVQITNATPGATYYVEVVAANPDGAHGVGNYFVGVNFATRAVALQEMTAGTCTAAEPVVERWLTVNDRSQFFHFVLSATASSAANVQMTITDSAGRVVFTLTASTAEAVSRNVTLAPGTYRVRFTATTPDGSALPDVAFRLVGETMTDPQGPEPTDPMAPPPEPGDPYDWGDGDEPGVPSQPPSSDPYDPATGGTTSSSGDTTVPTTTSSTNTTSSDTPTSDPATTTSTSTSTGENTTDPMATSSTTNGDTTTSEPTSSPDPTTTGDSPTSTSDDTTTTESPNTTTSASTDDDSTTMTDPTTTDTSSGGSPPA